MYDTIVFISVHMLLMWSLLIYTQDPKGQSTIVAIGCRYIQCVNYAIFKYTFLERVWVLLIHSLLWYDLWFLDLKDVIT